MSAYWMIWIHLVAVATLIGGLFFFLVVFRPTVQSLRPESYQVEVMRRVGKRFSTLIWISLIILLLTGASTMLHEGDSARIETTWGVVLMVKLFVFALMVGLVIIHDFILDPYHASSKRPEELTNLIAGKGKVYATQQGILLLSLLVLLIASYLTAM